MTQYTDTLTDTVDVGFLEALSVRLSVSDGVITLDGGLFADRAYALVLSDTINTSATLVTLWGETIAETVDLTPAYAASATFSIGLADSSEIIEGLKAGQGVTWVDQVDVAPTAAWAEAVAVAEALGIAVTISPSTTYSKVATDAVVITDALLKYLNGVVQDTAEITTTVLPAWKVTSTAADTVDVSEALTPVFVLRVTATDTVELTPSEVINAIYTGTVAEGIEIAAAYLSPGDALATWVVNTVNGATTEYQNYDFNSFAAMGQRYLGASSSGLWALDGDTDNGTDVIATIKSGLLQMTGPRFTSFRGAYIATHSTAEGATQFYLKLTTGDGAERTYEVNVRDQETTKIHLGKGLRARYMSFELVSTGQDFDLDSLEFVPIVSSRRV